MNSRLYLPNPVSTTPKRSLLERCITLSKVNAKISNGILLIRKLLLKYPIKNKTKIRKERIYSFNDILVIFKLL